MKAYQAAKQDIPDVISVWTSFPTDKADLGTFFLPCGNDTTGIGLETVYGKGNEVFASKFGKLRSILLHNNVLALKERAKFQGAPIDGFAEYLFLLEISHNWGPAIRLPEAGVKEDELIGFPFHWSFWMDAGGSPAGGNAWVDNANGTFSISPAKPKNITFSMLDLYLMGLADPREVTPFGVLQDVVPPGDIKDALTRGALSRTSFPHFGEMPITVTAKRHSVSIEDVIAANGERKPARANAKKDWTLGIVLFVGKEATPEETSKAEAAMDAIAPTLAPAFERATHARGTMKVVTKSVAQGPTEPPQSPEPAAPAPPTQNTAPQSGGCSTTPLEGDSTAAIAACAFAMLLTRRRRAS